MRHPILLLILLSSLLLSAGNQALAESGQEVQFKDITITTSNTHLLLFAVIKNNKSEELEQGLHSGIPMHFTFYIELFRTRKNWPDEELTAMEFSHTLKYDPLKERYQLDIEEQKNRVSSYDNLDEAMAVMHDINGLKLIKLTELQPDSSYELRIKAELYEKTLPMNLHYIIPFISLWNLETDWHTIEFTY
ncbi:MAG: DUF4390 domain-containing protein [Thermodesulfobacteriota bacterium]